MKKRYAAIPAALCVILGVCVFCESRNKVPADEKIDLVMRSKNFIRRLNRREFDSCCDMFGDTMAENNPAEKLKETFEPIMDSLGDFRCFRSATVTKKKYDGEEYTLCAVKGCYDKGDAAFTILFDEENKIDGVYVR